MNYNKVILVTSGCSFSETITEHQSTRPRHLATAINPKQFISKGMGSQGNGLISRSIIFQVSKLLKDGISPNDILVGIMWSGPNRWDYYWDNIERGGKWSSAHHDGWMNNPTNFDNNNTNGGWVVANQYWKSSKEFYKLYYDNTFGQINTLEHVLRTQWFLEKHNIKYFMAKYMNETFAKINKQPCLHLKDQIDWSKFISRQGCYEWCLETNPDYIDHTMHPTPDAHAHYTREFILPYLEQNF